MAEWSAAYVNDLPDSAFACPQQRKYPHHDATGKLDLPHLRAALSRIGDPSNDQCGKAHLQAHARAQGMGEGKAPVELKATLLDDDRFRLLAIPFGGPLNGRDLDGEYFSARTDIKPDWFDQRPVLWNHGRDRLLADRVIGKAVLDAEPDEDGWWVDVQLLAAERHAQLVQRLSQKAPLYGSSGTIGYLKKTADDGEILVWPYVEQTLTLTPSNTLSVSRPAKAVIDAYESAEITVSPAVKALLADLEALSADLAATSPESDLAAKAGLDAVYAATGKTLDELLRVLR